MEIKLEDWFSEEVSDERLWKAKLVTNLAKTKFAKAEVMLLGHKIGHGRKTPRNPKMKPIEEFPRPSLKKDVLRFLGLSRFYQKFVPIFSSVVAMLMDLLKKNTKFWWTEQCQEAFENLKAVITTAPVLATPNFLNTLKLLSMPAM
ncbi:uncharacterized protein LOC132210482 [Stegostoma tigrinum]|uniref:uncharacterized protein LOC132210482 n=1 Tax=Stegostoma tigrinum TaxID=3053191 RepID=UPI00287040D5|nr:uncharacterized protein LOC132210482 [Stegostoma tigrinum]